MNTTRIKRVILVAMVVAAMGAALTATTEAKPAYLRQAKALGFPAENCTYCHVKASGGAGWNARGQWLIQEKKNRNARTVSVEWLREYKE